MAEADILSQIETAFPGKIQEQHSLHGNATIVIDRADALEVLGELRGDADFAFNLLVDLTATDFYGKEPRFEVVYHLHSLTHNHRVRVKIRLSEDDPQTPSISALWKSANWLEREVWDMFGISFSGHPDLRRILMYEEFRGHPLRKDYPVNKRQPLVEERDPITNPWSKG